MASTQDNLRFCATFRCGVFVWEYYLMKLNFVFEHSLSFSKKGTEINLSPNFILA
jgi:hypothetical protein